MAVGMCLSADDFARVRRQPGVVIAGLVGPLLVLPVIAVCLIRLFETPPDIAAGVLLIAASPIGSVSNAFSALARASIALSVTLTGLSCVGAAITIPLVAKGLELALAKPFDLQAPLPLLTAQLLLVLALPVAIGMWIRRQSPIVAMTMSPVLQRLAIVMILFVLIVVTFHGGALSTGLGATVALAAAFVTASFAAGWSVSILVTRSWADRFAIASGFGARNIAIATAIAVALGGRMEFASFVAIYSLTELPLMLLVTVLFRRMSEAR